MTEKHFGRPWNADEDRLLIDAVHLYGENDRWKAIAEMVPGRTNKACRKRWLHSLSPCLKKTAWTPEEDQKLVQLYAESGAKWSTIARQIPGRTDDACSKRYREALDPSLKKDEWSTAEDEKLMDVYAQLGGKWGQVGQTLGRSGLGCRNRWRLLERKRANAAKDTLSPLPILHRTPPDPPPFDDLPSQSGGLYNGIDSSYWPSWFEDVSAIASPDMTTEQALVPYSPALLPGETLPPILPLERFPPFQFSSSSLSTALSTYLTTQPLPPVDLVATASPTIPAMEDTQPDDIPMSDVLINDPTPFTSPNQYSRSVLGETVSSCSSFENLPGLSPDRRTSELEGALFEPRLRSPNLLSPFANPCRSDPMSEETSNGSQENLRSRFRANGTSGYPRPHYFSSASASPNGLAGLSLSPTSSPSTSQPISLPSTRHTPSSDSVLFAPYSRPQHKSKSSNKKNVDAGQLRLSSNLAVTSDPNILPYACGHERCWPRDALMSLARFATSGELSEHFKSRHTVGTGGDKLFRCALEGCGKSWKNVNGLQYHLQISTAHFRNAITTTITTQARADKGLPVVDGSHDSGESSANNMDSAELSISGSNQRSSKESLRRSKKHYSCTVPECYKVYRQLSGLRYHLLHGHPREMPAQLDTIPPTLARQVDQKFRKEANVNLSPSLDSRGLPQQRAQGLTSPLPPPPAQHAP